MKIDLERGIIPLGPGPAPVAPAPLGGDGEFSDKLLQAIGQMEEVASNADRTSEGLITGVATDVLTPMALHERFRNAVLAEAIPL
jgi:hypothetical protein